MVLEKRFISMQYLNTVNVLSSLVTLGRFPAFGQSLFIRILVDFMSTNEHDVNVFAVHLCSVDEGHSIVDNSTLAAVNCC